MAFVSNLTQYSAEGFAAGFTDIFAPFTNWLLPVVSKNGRLNDINRFQFAYVTGSSKPGDYTTGYVSSGGGIAGKAVTMNTWLYQDLVVNDSEVHQVSGEALASVNYQAGQQVAADFLSSSLAPLLSATTTTSSLLTSNFSGSAGLAYLANLALVNKWPVGQRVLVAGPALYNALLQNTAVTVASNFANSGAEVARTGVLKNVYGFDVYPTTVNLGSSTNATFTSSISGFIAAPGAFGICMAYHNPQAGAIGNGLIEANPMNGPSGIVLGYKKYYNAAISSMSNIVEVLGGATAINPKALFIIGGV